MFIKNTLKKFITILTAPNEFYNNKNNTRGFIFPLSISIASQVIVILFYFETVDFHWFINQIIDGLPDGTPQKTKDTITEAHKDIGAGMSAVIGSLSTAVFIPIAFLIFSGYLTLVSLTRGDDISYGQWFSLACWSAAPLVVASVASVVNIALSTNGKLTQQSINPLTFNNLFFHLKANEPGASFYNAVDLSILWFMTLAAIGYRSWTNKKTTASTIIALTPFLLLYAGIALFSFS